MNFVYNRVEGYRFVIHVVFSIPDDLFLLIIHFKCRKIMMCEIRIYKKRSY